MDPKKGVFIAFIGPDGSGKSTVIEELTLAISKKESTVHVFHHRPTWIPHIGELFGKKLATDTAYTASDPHKAKPSGRLVSLIRLLYYTIDYTIGFSIKIRPLLKQGDTIIFDRYFYDFIIDPERSRIALPDVIPETILKFIYKPDRIFYLDNEPETLFARKKELTLVEMERQIKKYRALAARNRYFTVVPGNTSVMDIVAMVINKLQE